MGWLDDPEVRPTAPTPAGWWEKDPLAQAQPRAAEGAIESIKAGFQGSAPGLAWRGKLPELVMDQQHSKWWERALTGITQVASELPLMAVGGGAGGAAGTAAGGALTGPAAPAGAIVGGILGTGAGMFALPGAIRESLIQAYKSGEVTTGADWWNILREVATTTAKEAAIGAVTFGTGSVAAKVAGKALLPAIGESITVGTGIKAIGTADVAGQIAAMVTMPAALQGRLPDAQEFLDAAIVIGGLKLAHPMANRITNVFLRTGRTPAQQVADAQADPAIADELTRAANQEATGTTSGVPLKLDRLVAEAQFLARGGVPEAPNIKAIIKEIKEAGPLQGDMVRDLDRLDTLSGRQELTAEERVELETLAGKIKADAATQAEIEATADRAALQDLLVARLRTLEEKFSGTEDQTITDPEGVKRVIPGKQAEFMPPEEKAELTWLRDNIENQEAIAARYRLVKPAPKPDVSRETPPAPPPSPRFAPEQLTEAAERARTRLEELMAKSTSEALTDAERAERIGLTNALGNPEALAKRFGIEPAIKPITDADRQASAQRVYDDVLRQAQENNAARQAAGLEPLGDEHALAVATLMRARLLARATRLGVLPEDLYNERPLQIRDETQGGGAAAEAVIPPDAPRFVPPPEVDLFGNPILPTAAPRVAGEAIPIVAIPLEQLKISKDVPQFKAGANARGIVQPLQGEIDLRGVGPIAVWERLNGDLEVISGRHRWDLWERKGMKTIDAQIFKESEGFDILQATMLDAEMNIRDEHGSVSDYANYFKHSGLSQPEAKSRGLLDRAKGQAGFRIAQDASPDLLAAHRAGLLSDDAALVISSTAPGSERLQALGMAMVNEGKSTLFAANMMRTIDLMAAERQAAGAQGDIFGFDDSAMREAAAMAKKASSAQRKISEQISAVSGASRRPEIARKLGVDVQDPEGVQKKIAELKQEQYQWDNWPLYPELVAKLRAGDLKQDALYQTGTLAPSARDWKDAPLDDTKYITRDEYYKALNPYVKDGVVTANSRLVPNDNAFPPLGSWRIDTTKFSYGREIEKLVEIPIDDLLLGELDSKGRLDPAKAGDEVRYAEWIKDGKRPPPIEVVQTEEGRLSVTDGHRRALAARLAGAKTVEAWVNFAVPVPDGGRYGNRPEGKQIRTGMTYEMLIGEIPNPYLDRLPLSMSFDLKPETPAELKARDAEAVAAAKRKLAQDRLFARATERAATADDVNAAVDQRVTNGVLKDLQFLSDLAETGAASVEGLRTLDTPRQGVVLSAVLGAAHDEQVRTRIIELVPIDVVDVLRAQKLTPELLLDDPTMLKNLLSVDGDQPIAVHDAARRFVSVVAGLAAEGRLGDLGRRPVDGRSALGAGQDYGTRHTDSIDLFNTQRTLFQQANNGVPINPDALSKEVLSKIDRALKAMGYDSRGADDVRTMLKTRIAPDGVLSHPDWLKAYEQALEGVAKRKGKKAVADLAKEKATHVNFERIRELGTTADIREAGYITPTGSFVDLSGKREGGQAGTRAYDHREAGGTAGMQEFMALGNIRMDFNAGTMDISKEPTPEQYRKIAAMAQAKNGEIVIDLERKLGDYRNGYYGKSDSAFSREYPAGTKPARIMADIQRYYAGEEPLPLPRTLFQAATATDTPEFQRWFGASKVVNAEGEPLVVFHQTPENFEAFKPGGEKPTLSGKAIWFRPSPVESRSAHNTLVGSRIGQYKEGTQEIPAYVSIKRPLVIDDDTRAWAMELYGRDFPFLIKPETITELSKDYDGILYYSRADVAPSGKVWSESKLEEVIAFRPEQIKSAISNRGTFDPNDPNILLQKPGQEREGQHLGSYSIAENLITTFRNANKSTIVHELSHSWLEEMKADAARPDAPAQIKADWDMIRREFAIGENGEISTASHEQFARTGERYLGEGKAPSIGLRAVFEQFKTWMLQIYSNLQNLGVNINPEVRGLFDRILATDQEIADARAMDVPRAYVPEARRNIADRIVQPAIERAKIEPGFEAEKLSMEPYADEIPKGPGEAPDNSHINYAYINGPTDLKLAMQKMAEIDQARIQKRRGGTDGVKTWAEARAEQAKYIEDMLGGEPGSLNAFINNMLGAGADQPRVDALMGIIKRVTTEAAKDSARLRDVVLAAGHDATVKQQLEYMGSIERTAMIHAEMLGQRAAIARAMNALKDTTEGSGEIGRMLDVIGYGEAAARELFQAARTPAEEQAYMRLKLDEILQNYKGKTVLEIAKLHKEIGTLKGTFKFSKEVTKATKWEMVVEGWKASLLSGPVTHTTNMFGTEGFHFLRPAVDMLAATIGMARGASPGMGESDRASMSEAVARLGGMMSGIKDGVKVAVATFKLDDPTGKTEAYRTAIPGRAGELIRIPLRLMGAEDALVTTMYKRGELATLAIRQAFDEQMNPSTREFAERVSYLKDHPTPEMEAASDAAATRMTFNAPLGEKGVALQLFVNKWNLQWMIPFIRTPINITKEVARMSPLAPLVGEWRAAIAKGGVERDRALAELAIGTGIMALAMAMTFDETLSGAGSPDPGKNRGKVGVWQPYSRLIGDTWYEYARIQPVGTLVGMAADVATIWDHMNDEEKDKIPKLLAVAFSNAVTNQTFLQGITNVVNAMSEPTRFLPRFANQMAASMIPNIIAQPTAMADPVVREVNGMLEAIQARIPGLRQDLAPKLDWLGEPVQSKERVGVVMPVRTQKISEDKVRLEAARLELSLAAAPKKTHIGKGTGKLGDVELTPEERNTFAKVGGEFAHQILTNIVNAPGYENIPDLVKRKIFRDVIAKSHQLAAAAALPMDKRLAYIQSITERVTAELQPSEAQ